MHDHTPFHSKNVVSNQHGVHKNLLAAVQKHQQHPFQKPYRQHNLHAFKQLQDWLTLSSTLKKGCYPPRILDSGCGTAMSSRHLAEHHPDHLIIGIDQSAHRLQKGQHQGNTKLPTNCLLLQANCEDIWRLCLTEPAPFDTHYILYPNPWPKSKHLKRRWHGHPCFPILPQLARKTVLRSNWRLYLEEFQQAWQLLVPHQPTTLTTLDSNQPPLTLFERKYAKSGQTLYELVVYSP